MSLAPLEMAALLGVAAFSLERVVGVAAAFLLASDDDVGDGNDNESDDDGGDNNDDESDDDGGDSGGSGCRCE